MPLLLVHLRRVPVEGKRMEKKEEKVYGPYKLSTGREYVIVKYSDGSRRTISYPKYLVEKQLGRELEEDETVDHIDRNFLNNDPSNLQVLKRSKHAKVDSVRLKPVTFTCPICKRQFRRSGSRLARIYERKKSGTAGPFCSRKCEGRYAADLREGLRFPLFETYEEFLAKHPKEYYQRDK